MEALSQLRIEFLYFVKYFLTSRILVHYVDLVLYFNRQHLRLRRQGTLSAGECRKRIRSGGIDEAIFQMGSSFGVIFGIFVDVCAVASAEAY